MVGDTTFQATANYSCNLGYFISGGDTTRTCGPDEVWSGEPLICTSMYHEREREGGGGEGGREIGGREGGRAGGGEREGEREARAECNWYR